MKTIKITLCIVTLVLCGLMNYSCQKEKDTLYAESEEVSSKSLNSNPNDYEDANPYLHFLPPLGFKPEYSGEFDAGLNPVVNICEWDGMGCRSLTAIFGMNSVPTSESVRISDEEDFYIVNWNTSRFNLIPGNIYRIQIIVAGTLLGHSDVLIVNEDARKYDDNGRFLLKMGTTLPIKFRIEKGAVFPVGPNGGTFTTPCGRCKLNIPPGAVSSEVGITILPFDKAISFPDLLPGPAFKFGPVGLEFAVPALLTMKYDESDLGPYNDESKLMIFTLGQFGWTPLFDREWPYGTADPIKNELTAEVFHFSNYGIGNLELHSTEIYDFLKAMLKELNNVCTRSDDLRFKSCFTEQILFYQNFVETLSFLPGISELAMNQEDICGGILDNTQTELSIEPHEINLEVGETGILTATPYVGDQIVTGISEIQWHSENSDVATVSNGIVTAIGPGSVQIFASAKEAPGGCSSTVLTGFAIVTVPEEEEEEEPKKKVDIVFVAECHNSTYYWMGFDHGSENNVGLIDIASEVVDALNARFEDYRFGFTAAGGYPEIVYCDEGDMEESWPYMSPQPYYEWVPVTNSSSTIMYGLSNIRLFCMSAVSIGPHGSSTYTAILHAINHTNWREGAERIVIVLMNSLINWSDPINDFEWVTGYTSQTVNSGAINKSVRLYSLAGTSTSGLLATRMESMSLNTGGNFYYANTLWPILNALERVFDDIQIMLEQN